MPKVTLLDLFFRMNGICFFITFSSFRQSCKKWSVVLGPDHLSLCNCKPTRWVDSSIITLSGQCCKAVKSLMEITKIKALGKEKLSSVEQSKHKIIDVFPVSQLRCIDRTKRVTVIFSSSGLVLFFIFLTDAMILSPKDESVGWYALC